MLGNVWTGHIMQNKRICRTVFRSTRTIVNKVLDRFGASRYFMASLLRDICFVPFARSLAYNRLLAQCLAKYFLFVAQTLV